MSTDPSGGIKEILSDVTDHPWVGEGLLVRTIIPKIFGIGEKQDLGIWMEYTGGMWKPLSIRNEKGEEVFLAPPPLNNVIQIRAKRAESGEAPFLSNIADKAIRKRELIPAMGESYLRQHLSYTLERIEDEIPEDTDSTVDTWRQILIHYGFIQDESKDSNANGTTGTATTGSNTGSAGFVISDEDELL